MDAPRSSQSGRRRTIIYELATPAFCEYGGIQTSPEYSERPVDMPPMVSGSVGGIRPGLTMAWKHNRMPPFCKMATRTFKISETYSAAPRPRMLFYDMSLTLRCANIFTPGREIRWLSSQWRFRCAWFPAPGSPEHR